MLLSFIGGCCRLKQNSKNAIEPAAAEPQKAEPQKLPTILPRLRATRELKEMSVDRDTKVPADLYMRLQQAGDRAKVRGEHTLEVVRSSSTATRRPDGSAGISSMRLVKTQSLQDVRKVQNKTVRSNSLPMNSTKA